MHIFETLASEVYSHFGSKCRETIQTLSLAISTAIGWSARRGASAMPPSGVFPALPDPRRPGGFAQPAGAAGALAARDLSRTGAPDVEWENFFLGNHLLIHSEQLQ